MTSRHLLFQMTEKQRAANKKRFLDQLNKEFEQEMAVKTDFRKYLQKLQDGKRFLMQNKDEEEKLMHERKHMKKSQTGYKLLNYAKRLIKDRKE